MIVLDEHIPPFQRQLLHSRRIRASQVGYDVGWKGMHDEEIIPLLHGLRRPTFITLDAGFYDQRLCHRRYCLAYLSVKQQEAAIFVRRLLRHPEFNTQAKRMETVVRVSSAGLSVWRLQGEAEIHLDWVE